MPKTGKKPNNPAKQDSAPSSFDLGVVDLAKGPPVLGSLARFTTSAPVFYLDRAIAEEVRILTNL
jgi:hypothetical protein